MNTASWVEINAQALAHNIASYKRLAGSAGLAVVVKSNAYGHGLTVVAPLLERMSGVAWLCTASLSEAVQVRQLGVTKPILVLSYIDMPYAHALEHAISLVVYDEQTLHELATQARRMGKKAYVHVKVDTGLSRLGVLYPQAMAFIQRARDLGVCVQGGCTHLADAESADQRFVREQLERLDAITVALHAQGVPALVHASCSALFGVTDRTYDLMRLGLGAYGLWPSLASKNRGAVELQPVLAWKTRVIQVKEVPVGSTIGYDRTYVAQRPMRLALLPVGYYDGYDRSLSNTGFVSIQGKKAPVVGRVSMNITTVDVTDCGVVAQGDEVVLIGAGVPADELGPLAHTINYELVTRINPLIARIVV